ncbi:hypothetical protein FDZ71_00420 [bacterium]|nr:MAG: hypothetical protein FDZ71_00420 [bacterium]
MSKRKKRVPQGFTGLPDKSDPDYEAKMKNNKPHAIYKGCAPGRTRVDIDYHGKPQKCGSDQY